MLLRGSDGTWWWKRLGVRGQVVALPLPLPLPLPLGEKGGVGVQQSGRRGFQRWWLWGG